MVAADRAEPGYDAAGKALGLALRAWEAGGRNGALEFLQFALYRNPSEPGRIEEARRLAHEWTQRAASEIGVLPAGGRAPGAGPLRIGHLLGLVNPTHAPTKLVQLLISGFAAEEVRSFVYASEWAAGWFQNWTHHRQSGPPEFLRSLKAETIYVHEAGEGFVSRAASLAERIHADALDVLVVHASLHEMVTSVTALMRPAWRQVNVNHASEMDLPCFDGVVHMFANGLARSRTRDIPAVVIPPASDMGERIRQAPKLTAADLCVPPDATISGTFGNLYKIENQIFQASLRGLLEAQPKHHHLIAGGGDERVIAAFLAETGLAGRVHLLGRRTDIPSLLPLLNFYLASHPYPGALSEIEAMAAACPVISMRADPESHYNAGAEVVGLPECIVDFGDSGAVAALASRYLADPAWGRDVGHRLQERYDQMFTPARVISRHLEFYRSLLPENARNDRA